MRLDYKIFFVLSMILLMAFIILVAMKKGEDARYIILGLGIGSGLRAIYEFLKKKKQTPQ
jgi:ABC-type enterobactin transport system permease subunit